MQSGLTATVLQEALLVQPHTFCFTVLEVLCAHFHLHFFFFCSFFLEQPFYCLHTGLDGRHPWRPLLLLAKDFRSDIFHWQLLAF